MSPTDLSDFTTAQTRRSTREMNEATAKLKTVNPALYAEAGVFFG